MKAVYGWAGSALALAAAMMAVAGAAAPARQQAKRITPQDERFFEEKVRPLLAEKCFSCHGPEQQKGGLRLDSSEAVRKGAASGPVIAAPENASESRLLKAVHYSGTVRMPPAGKLAPAEIAVLEEWVKRGAPWPQRAAAPGAGLKNAPSPSALWSLKPVKALAAPKVAGLASASPIDAFLLDALKRKGLAFAPKADRRVLIRRATFDLTGLPPTPEEVAAFLADKSPNAWEKVVDRLLASPRYGERWGRHWLDLVRYCDSLDSRGVGADGDLVDAWRYRDWVINALNTDMPYDRFVAQQVAGDILSAQSPAGFDRDMVIATGLLAIGNWGNGDADKEKIYTDIVDDQVDVVTRAFLGLTVACARCHDHKFDPISAKDYYRLAGIFFSTRILAKFTPKGEGEKLMRIPLVSPAELEERRRHATRATELEKLTATLREEARRDLAKALLPATAEYALAAWQSTRADGEGTLAQLAEKRGLHAFALQKWADLLGIGAFGRMTTAMRDVLNAPGVFGLRGAPDTPSALVNTNRDAKTLLTFVLPPRSLTLHPGPSGGIAAAWVSPVAGTVRVSGRLADADPVGGDGIAWVIALRGRAGLREIAKGNLDNAGAQELAAGMGGADLAKVAVRPGERIELHVLPKGNHGFDTTVVEWTITDETGRTWALPGDVLETFPQGGNPLPDRQGNRGVWSFEDMTAGATAAKLEGPAGAALAKWREAAARPDATVETVTAAAKELAAAFDVADARSPFWVSAQADEAALPQLVRERISKVDEELAAHRKRTFPPLEYANGALDGGIPETPYDGFHDARVHIRGAYSRLGETVPRGFPTVLAFNAPPKPMAGSGRLELAKWLTDPRNPLTARVIVNRVWQHHFGEGIVRTPSNFGVLGEKPTNPALLDWLADRFVREGWSLKKLHRLVMLSEAYQQSGKATEKARLADPDNRLFGRMNRRRLEAEPLRDSLLAAAGRLDLTPGGPAYRDFNTPRRTVYNMTIRSDRAGFGPLFDMADSTSQVEKRTDSTVAPQALYLLNNPFVEAQAKALAARVAAWPEKDDAARIARLYELLYARPATVREVEVGRRMLERARAATGAKDEAAAWQPYCQILLCANEFLFVD